MNNDRLQTLKPLSPSCADCRERPTHKTRQKAVLARPALDWLKCCAKHAPKNNRFHQTLATK